MLPKSILKILSKLSLGLRVKLLHQGANCGISPRENTYELLRGFVFAIATFFSILSKPISLKEACVRSSRVAPWSASENGPGAPGAGFAGQYNSEYSRIARSLKHILLRFLKTSEGELTLFLQSRMDVSKAFFGSSKKHKSHSRKGVCVRFRPWAGSSCTSLQSKSKFVRPLSTTRLRAAAIIG